jgi:CheY-like chemotaxis protein
MANSLEGRHVLVVDDEPDVCDMVADVLAQCDVDKAYTYEEAKQKLDSAKYDLVILDIMGVKGHELLDVYGKSFPCIMLTAHALNVDAMKLSVGGHARLFLPKEELPHLEEYAAQVLEAKRPLWSWLLQKLDFRRWFGSDFSTEDFLGDLTLEDVIDDLERRRS